MKLSSSEEMAVISSYNEKVYFVDVKNKR